MDCEKFRMMLDAYIDGELSDLEEAELAEHAKACAACREELTTADMMRDALAHMDDDITVPLQAQAAWRNAVRAEAKKKNMRKWTRAAYAVAAALVVVFGASLFMNKAPETGGEMVVAARGVPENVQIIQRDGGEEATAPTEGAAQDYTILKKISAGDPEAAFESLKMLCAEYSGSCLRDGDGICRIELPYEYMQDFLKAASRIGTETESYSRIAGADGETAVILIQIEAE